jgi:glutathionyl-hydroquinone reductase
MRTKDSRTNALHEVMQQIALTGLYRGGFFDRAAVYGDACLRIFYGLQRYSGNLGCASLGT